MNVKGVIVAAGYGSRFLPVTKTIPKEMLPLIDKPAIAFIVDEFLQSGIREILIISSRRKKALEDYFDREVELEQVFTSETKTEALEKIDPGPAQMFFTRQQVMNGTGHALLLAEAFTADSPFVVAYPDDLVFSKTPLSRQLIEAYKSSDKSVLAVKNLIDEDVSRYGVIDPATSNNPYQVRRLVEKPPPGKEPSHLVSFGRYLFKPQIYEHLREGLKHHTGGEYYHVPAINALAAEGRMVALDFEGDRLDTGDPVGFLEATCRYALSHPKYRERALELFKELANCST